jgi:DNA-binding NtrC family response regulator
MNSRSTRLLVVDDDVDTCSNLSDILSDFGFEVDTAPNGPAALELVRRNVYDVALLDFKMPGMDGLTLYREIKKLSAATVAIIVTAYASRDTELSARDAGAWKIMPKPVDLARLMPLVDEALRQPLILVVDDDQDLCTSLWDLLRERDYRICLAHSVPEAEERLLERDYKVVLVDLKLPGRDGTDLLKATRQQPVPARVVLITGHQGELEQVIEQALSEGADAVCYKPFNLEALLKTVSELTGKRPAT